MLSVIWNGISSDLLNISKYVIATSTSPVAIEELTLSLLHTLPQAFTTYSFFNEEATS